MPCKACGRRFAPDRVALHEQICIKTGQKKRKQFDTMMYRVKGTDIEPFVKKGLVKKQMEVSVPILHSNSKSLSLLLFQFLYNFYLESLCNCIWF